MTIKSRLKFIKTEYLLMDGGRKMRKARVIYNPSAGRETFKNKLAYVLNQLELSGYEASAHATTGEGDATRAAKQAVERGFELLIIAGGDGTINEVVKGIAQAPKRPKIGVIPTGTTNDFARALELPREIEAAVDVITEGHSKKIDIGQVNDQYFINIAGGGELTELSYEVPIKLKTVIGQLAYYVKGIEMLPFIKPIRARVEFDGEVFDDEMMLFLVTNTNSVGGFEKLAPEAKLNDGYFHLIILRKVNLAEFIHLATLALRGAHLENKNIIYTKAKRIKIEPEANMQLNIDGEFGGMLPGEIINLQEHIEFYVPQSLLEKEAEEKNILEN